MARLGLRREAAAGVRYLSLVRDVPDLRRLWLGSGVSQFGDGVQGIALLWLATHGSSVGLALGLVTLALFGPPVIVGPLLGALADRVSRKRILVTSDLLRIVTAGCVPLLYHAFGLGAVVGITVVHSVLSTAFNAAYNAALPEVAGRERVIAANGLMQVTGYLADVAGSGVGGVFVATLPLALPFVLNAATYAWSAAMNWRLTSALHPLGHQAMRPRYLSSLREGFGYARSQSAVLAYTVIGLVAAVGFAPAPVAIVDLARQALRAGSVGYGLLEVAITLGLAVGAAIAGRLVTKHNAVRAMIIGYLAMAACTALLGLSTKLWVAFVIMALRMTFNGLLMVAGVSIIQLKVPDQYRGRTFTLIGSTQELPRLIFLPLAGVLLDQIGVRALFIAMACFIGAGGLIATAASPTLRISDEPPAEQPAGSSAVREV